MFSLLTVAAVAHGTAFAASQKKPVDTIDAGYSALKIFLEDEQYLTAIRIAKTLLSFEGISDNTKKLIDEISDSSEKALEELEQLAARKPVIVFEEFSDESIGKATLDSMRLATAKEFLFDTDDFEKNLLLSQSQILRVISHLARQLEEKETDAKRKAWLNKLAARYENYYKQVYARISINNKGKA